MTLREAIKYVEEAEQLPAEDIDREKLVEAIKTIAAEADNNFFETGLRQIREAPANLEAILDELTVPGSTEAFLPGAGEVIDAAFTKAVGVLRRLVDRGSTVQEARAAEEEEEEETGPGREGEPLGPGQTRGGGTPRERAAALSTSAAPQEISPTLIDRFFKAAEQADVSPDEARAEFDKLKAGGGSFQVPHPVTGEMMTIDVSEGEATPEQLIEAKINEWTGGAIGVQPGFFAQRETPVADSEGLEKFRMARGIAPTTRTQEIAPRYFVGDHQNYAGLPTEQIAALQQRLVDAGQLEPDEYHAGVWDTKTSNAMLGVMGMANASGLEVSDQLKQLAANLPESVKEARNAAKLADQFQADAFVPMDKAAIAQSVKQAIRNRVGRDPRPEELTEIAALMAGFDRADYEQQIAVARAEFEAQKQALDTGQFVTPTGLPADVDPWQQLDAYLDQRLGAEEGFIEAQADTAEATQRVLQSLGLMNRLIAGR